MLAQCAGGQDLAQVGAGLGERDGGQVAVADEVDAVEEQGEDDGEVALALNGAVFVFERSDEGVCEVWGNELCASD